MAKRQYQSGPFLNGSRRTLMCSGLHAVTVCNCIPMQMLFRTCPSHVRLLTCWRCSNHWPSRRSQVIHDYIHDMLVILSESHGCAPSRPRWLIPCTPFSCPLKPRAYPGLVTPKKKKESRDAPSSCCFYFGVTFHHLSHYSGILPTLPATPMMYSSTSTWQSLPPLPMPSRIPGVYPRISAFAAKA